MSPPPPAAGESAAEALKAGAYLHPDTAYLGEAVPVTARAYRRPGLIGRTVVRLVPEEIGAAEDAAAAYLGLERVGPAAHVGFGLRGSLAFPEWVLVHHPEDGHHALGLMPEIDRLSRTAATKPKVAYEGFSRLGERLASSVPHLLPLFYERAARELLAAEKPELAARLFTFARKAETEHGLPIDEDRLDDVFVEFALAGALPARTLSEFGKALALRLPPEEALRRFLRIAVRRTSGGLPPSSTTAPDVRRLAKAAAADVARVEREYLAELLTFPSTALATEAWWKGHRAALVALAAQRPEIRALLLRITPDGDHGFLEFWLDLLAETGAAALLHDGAEGAGPEDGVAGWLERLLKARGQRYRAARRLTALEPLVVRMAGRLKAETAERGAPLAVPQSADLLDLLLELGVPVADPVPGFRAALDTWARGEGRRGLAALCADPRFAAGLRSGIEAVAAHDAVQPVLSSAPALRPHLLAYAEGVAGRVAWAGLPGLQGALGALADLPEGIRRIAEEPVRAGLAVDIPDLLARTLRGGLLDELHWPAFENAVDELFPEGYQGPRTIAEEWPYLVVAGAQRALVLDGSGVALDHHLRMPQKTYSRGFRYVDGALLVHWSENYDSELKGYWHTRPDHVMRLKGDRANGLSLPARSANGRISVEAPGGGRVTGAAVIHRGDAVAPAPSLVASDGARYWTGRYSAGRLLWHTVDPRTGEVGEPDPPAFLAEPGPNLRSGFLAPLPGGGTTPIGAVVDGVFGHRAVAGPDGSVRGEDLAGALSPAVSGHVVPWPLRLPGDDGARGLVRVLTNHSTTLRLIGPDGLVLAEDDRRFFRLGTRDFPPVQYWVHMRPRDARGSARLRGADRALAERLLEGGETWGEVTDRVTAALPELSDVGLIHGVVGVVAGAIVAREAAADARERIERELAPSLVEELPESPTDAALQLGLDGLRERTGSGGHQAGSARLLWRLARLREGAYRAAEGETPHVPLPSTSLGLHWVVDGLTAITLIAASEATAPEARTALRELLGLLDEAGLRTPDPAAWRMLRVRPAVQPAERTDLLHAVPLEGGAFFAVVEQRWTRRNQAYSVDLEALFHDPSGRFAVPEGYEVLKEEPLTEVRPDPPVTEVMALVDARGPAPWNAEKVAEFARLTGVTHTMAALVLSGGLGLWGLRATLLSAAQRRLMKVKVAEVEAANQQLRRLSGEMRRELFSALMPADPVRLWTEGPDAAAAAAVWNRAVAPAVAVPEALLTEAAKELGHLSVAQTELRAVLDPAANAELSQDARWRAGNFQFEVAGGYGFTARTLTSAVRALAWLAHRLPAGDPLRARLPAGLAAVRARLAHPELVLWSEHRVSVPEFARAAGAPDEEGERWARYGPVLVLTDRLFQRPGVRAAFLDSGGDDPRLALLRDKAGRLMAWEVALRAARDERFAALLADPGEPVEGGRFDDGTWYPQDPSRSVPELVVEAAKESGLSADAAAVYLMLLAMPDPTDRNTARWTGWKPARLKAARAELAATGLVTEGRRTKAGRTLFLPCPWSEARGPRLPMEEWKHELYGFAQGGAAPLTAVVPAEPVAEVYRRAWRRVAEGDVPRFGELEIPRAQRRR
ncbi:DNA-binding protein [Actinocorallia aurea]